MAIMTVVFLLHESVFIKLKSIYYVKVLTELIPAQSS